MSSSRNQDHHRKPMTVHASGSYLGDSEDITLKVRWGASTHVKCDFDGISCHTIAAVITERDDADGLVIESMMALRECYREKLGGEPSEELEHVWEEALRQAWGRVFQN
jgi:hypothetical protein